ncbi:MAG TPA: hypothetical protein VGM25_16665 [Caulobacteraceae bacterium]
MEAFAPPQIEDDDQLSQLVGPARALLARTEALTLSTQRSATRCLLGGVFFLCAAGGAGALTPFAAPENRGVVIAGAVLLALAGSLLFYGMSQLRFDLGPLGAFTQELRIGLQNAEKAHLGEELEAQP